MAETSDGDRPSTAGGDSHRSAPESTLTPSQRRAARLIALGRKISKVARAIGVDDGTIFRWRRDSKAFREEITRLENESIDRIQGALVASFFGGLHQLEELQHSDDDFVKLGAAKARTDYGARLLLAILQQRFKSGVGIKSAEEQAEEFIAALREMDKVSGELG